MWACMWHILVQKTNPEALAQSDDGSQPEREHETLEASVRQDRTEEGGNRENEPVNSGKGPGEKQETGFRVPHQVVL